MPHWQCREPHTQKCRCSDDPLTGNCCGVFACQGLCVIVRHCPLHNLCHAVQCRRGGTSIPQYLSYLHAFLMVHADRQCSEIIAQRRADARAAAGGKARGPVYAAALKSSLCGSRLRCSKPEEAAADAEASVLSHHAASSAAMRRHLTGSTTIAFPAL